MIVNSIRGPLNCSEYDSALLATELNAPVAGSAVGLIHASTDTRAVGDTAALDAICTRELLLPENDAARSLALASNPGWFNDTLLYVPLLAAPAELAADVPEVSSSRQ